MKCLVFSDSHGDTAYIKRAILKNKDAEVLFFLGDGLYDIDEVASRDSQARYSRSRAIAITAILPMIAL